MVSFLSQSISSALHFNKNTTQAHLLPFSLTEHFTEGAYIENENLIINHNHNTFSMSIHDLALQGKHNQYNSMAAGLSARVLEVRKEIIRESLEDFVNVEHRLEFVPKQTIAFTLSFTNSNNIE